MTTYSVKYRYLGGRTNVYGIVDDAEIEAIKAEGHVIDECVPYTPVIRYRTAEGCERCKTDEYVPHYNCLYHGKAVGHSEAHCTASACY